MPAHRFGRPQHTLDSVPCRAEHVARTRHRRDGRRSRTPAERQRRSAALMQSDERRFGPSRRTDQHNRDRAGCSGRGVSGPPRPDTHQRTPYRLARSRNRRECTRSARHCREPAEDAIGSWLGRNSLGLLHITAMPEVPSACWRRLAGQLLPDRGELIDLSLLILDDALGDRSDLVVRRLLERDF
jgi:hypothetical protein